MNPSDMLPLGLQQNTIEMDIRMSQEESREIGSGKSMYTCAKTISENKVIRGKTAFWNI